MPEIDLAVFDVAGTTIKDSDDVNRCLQSALKEAGVEVPLSQVNATMGLPKPIAIQRLLDETGIEANAAEIHADFVERMKQFYRESDALAPYDGIEQVIHLLRESGIKVALDTGFSADITDVILEKVGWKEGVIDGVVSSDQVERGRPYPDMIHFLMSELGVEDVNRVAKFGDAPADLNEGSNTGCRFVVGVLWGTHNREQLSEYPHTHLIESIEDIPALLLSEEL